MSMLNATPMLSLSAASGSFSFPAKYIPLATGKRIVLGSETAPTGQPPRTAQTTNGWFAASGSSDAPISPLSLSSSHAEVWTEGGKINIRDLDTPFGTFVNDTKIKGSVQLKTGDVISLGSTISRNAKTPSYITDDQLKAVTLKVTLFGVSS